MTSSSEFCVDELHIETYMPRLEYQLSNGKTSDVEDFADCFSKLGVHDDPHARYSQCSVGEQLLESSSEGTQQ